MSQARSLECPSCGASLAIQGDQIQIKCSYCGRSVIVPEELRLKRSEQTPVFVAPAASPAESLGRRSGRRAVWQVVAAIVLVAIAVVVLNGLDGGFNGEPPVAPISRPLEGTLPRQVQYANLQFSVERATISNEQPYPFGDSPEYSRNQGYAYIDVSIVNPISENIFVDRGLARLKLGDQLYSETSGWANNVAPQSSTNARWVFEVPIDAAWENAELILAEPDKQPARLPLTGSAATAEYPIHLSAGGEATAQEVTYTILSATLDLDGFGKRAEAGMRYLILEMRFTNNSTFAGGFPLLPDDFRLIVDELPIAPIVAPIQVLQARSALEDEVLFEFPVSASDVALQVGEVGKGDTALIPISLPSSP